MEELAIVIFSCDKNEELWPIFHHFLNKNWPNHPNTYLFTESKTSNLFNTITIAYKLDKWTKRIRQSLNKIKENKIIFICDDCFINKEVNIPKLKEALNILDNKYIANINFELSFEKGDAKSIYKGFKRKTENSRITVSLLCGLWNKKALLDVLSKDSSPWEVERYQNSKLYEYYQVCDDKIVSWFRDGPYQFAAIHNGKWSKDTIDFFKSENIEVEFNKKGFVD